MALSIKNDGADRLARELATLTGESLTEAVPALTLAYTDCEGVAELASVAEDLERIVGLSAGLRRSRRGP